MWLLVFFFLLVEVLCLLDGEGVVFVLYFFWMRFFGVVFSVYKFEVIFFRYWKWKIIDIGIFFFYFKFIVYMYFGIEFGVFLFLLCIVYIVVLDSCKFILLYIKFYIKFNFFFKNYLWVFLVILIVFDEFLVLIFGWFWCLRFD